MHLDVPACFYKHFGRVMYFENPVGEMYAVLYVRLKEFTMLLLMDKVIWVLTPYRLVNIDGRFQCLWFLNPYRINLENRVSS